MGTCFSVLIRMELARLRDQIIPLWMYPSRADVGFAANKLEDPGQPQGPIFEQALRLVLYELEIVGSTNQDEVQR